MGTRLITRDNSAQQVQWIDATPVAVRADLASIAFAANTLGTHLAFHHNIGCCYLIGGTSWLVANMKYSSQPTTSSATEKLSGRVMPNRL